MLTISINQIIWCKNVYHCHHKGENLFWFEKQPDGIPVFDFDLVKIMDTFDDLGFIRNQYKEYAIRWEIGGRPTYSASGLDCDGTPAFSHYTADDIANGYNNVSHIHQFIPLTVETVVKWFGWWLYNLENTRIDFTSDRPFIH